MSVLSEKKLPRWRKLPGSEAYRAESYLREREKFCVAASSRFLRLEESRGHIWQLSSREGEKISALLLHSRGSLFPIFDRNTRALKGESGSVDFWRQVPGPRFLSRFSGKLPVHSVQGLREDVELFENLMRKQDYFAVEQIDYDLMSLDSQTRLKVREIGPVGLTLRPPLPKDEESLFALQSSYEQEEVLSVKSVFNPAVCRLNLQRLLSRERILVAVLDGQVVGKINTSARSFTRYQIGGVYVRPDCRGLGIGAMMTAFFTRSLLIQGNGVTLFVKKRNAAAREMYRKAGFSTLADYRITYY